MFLLLFCLLMCFLQVGTVEFKNVVITSVDKSIRLDCDDRSKTNNQWKHESKVLFAGQNAISDSLQFMVSVELCDNYSLIIQSPGKIHEGRYKCIRNSRDVAKYILEIQLISKIHIVVEEWNASREIFLREEDFVTIYCQATGVRPNVTINLIVNSLQMGSENDTKISEIANSFNLTTVNSMKKLRYQPNAGRQNVSCSTSGHFKETIVEISFTVIKPKDFVVLNIRDQYPTREVYIEAGNEMFIQCNAHSANQFLNLTWKLNHPVNSSNTTSALSSRKLHENNTFYSLIFLRYLPQSEEGHLTCRSESTENETKGSVSIKVFTYIPPVVWISINGKTIENQLSVPHKKQVKLRCEAAGARPQVNLTINSSNGDRCFAKVVKAISQHMTAVDFEYQALTPNASITCIATSSITEQQRNKIIHLETIYGEVANGEETSFTNFQLFAGFGGLLMCFVIVFVVFMLCVLNRNRRNGSPHDSGIFLGERKPERETPSAQTSLQAVGAEGEEFQTLAKTKQMIPIPDGTDQVSSDEDEHYSELEESKRRSRIVNLKEIRLLFNMEEGKIFSRWVGMLETSSCPARCVLLSTLKDDKEQTSGIKWGAYLQRRLELPNADYVARTEGLCIDGAKTYIINEYFTCENLEMYVGNQDPQDSGRLTDKIPEVNRKALVIDLFSGIDFIHSYGFLHPGLSAKKLLITDQGTLKLYDFCLAEDAPNIVRIIKKQIAPSMSPLPPEALSRNEYTKASDVWSIALLVSNLISKGFLRMVHEEDANDGATSPTYTQWFCTAQHYDIIDRFLSKCWNSDSSKRPTLREMKLDFEKMLVVNNHSSPSDGAAPDLYTPMRSITA